MLSSGSMACSLSTEEHLKLLQTGVVHLDSHEPTDVIFVGCGGVHVKPTSVISLTMDVYECKMSVHPFVIEYQHDDLIVGSNIIRQLIT